MAATFPVIVQLIAEDACTQWYKKGRLNHDEIEAMKRLFNSGPMERQDVVTYEPETLAASALRRIYRYTREESGEPYQEDLFDDNGCEFVTIKEEDANDEPAYWIVFQGVQ